MAPALLTSILSASSLVERAAEETLEGRYADVTIEAAPEWLAQRLAGPYTAGYSTQLLLSGLFFQQFLSFTSSGEFSRLPRRASKLVLVSLLVLNLLYTGIAWAEQWILSTNQHRTTEAFIKLDYAWNLFPLLAGWIAALTQGFLAMRAGGFIPSKPCRWAFYSWIGLLILVGLFGSTLTAALGTLWVIRGGLAILPIGWNNAVAIWLSASAAADVSISAALAWTLRRRIAGFNMATDGLLRQLIWLALRTASYTAVLSVVGAIVAGLWRDGDYATCNLNIPFWFCMPALYGISVFTTVSSSRRALSSSIGTGEPSSRDVFALPSASGFAGGIGSYIPPPPSAATAAGTKNKGNHRRWSSFNGVVSGVPVNPSPSSFAREPKPSAAGGAKRNSRHSLIMVTTEVERKVEEEEEAATAYEEIRLNLHKDRRVTRWLTKEGEEDEEEDEESEEEKGEGDGRALV